MGFGRRAQGLLGGLREGTSDPSSHLGRALKLPCAWESREELVSNTHCNSLVSSCVEEASVADPCGRAVGRWEGMRS